MSTINLIRFPRSQLRCSGVAANSRRTPSSPAGLSTGPVLQAAECHVNDIDAQRTISYKQAWLTATGDKAAVAGERIPTVIEEGFRTEKYYLCTALARFIANLRKTVDIVLKTQGTLMGKRTEGILDAFARKKDAPRRRQDGARSSHMREDAVDIYNGTTYKMPQRSPARLPTSIGAPSMRFAYRCSRRHTRVKFLGLAVYAGIHYVALLATRLENNIMNCSRRTPDLAIPEPESPQEVLHVSSGIPGEALRSRFCASNRLPEIVQRQITAHVTFSR
ncbi:hypothetical protein CISG_00106 [Coccidioides immitis RMSCC 3703]|uniref:Uncharacterized protein n=2 Tax=Coccidioides immitis TaxID=5501 RepID=A0A0J8QH48_COCIT|nr:hypothetical protein CIRG_07430 [Coccidioides immitis RMSCC 2394]KMU71796.1 hypothetical protein CISG_00106 [Coccidioides immitis RMSCC 3703]